MRPAARILVLLTAIGVLGALAIPSPVLALGPASLGVKAGVTFADVSTPGVAAVGTGLEHRFGPAGGVSVSWSLNDRVSVGGEVLYVSKGFSFGRFEATDASGTTIGTFEAQVVVDYVEVPILARIGLVTAGPVRPALLLGPAIATKVRERFKLTGVVHGSSKTDAFTGADLGLTAGAEVRFRTGPGWSVIDARYTLGLLNVAEDPSGDAKNRALTVMAGYAF